VVAETDDVAAPNTNNNDKEPKGVVDHQSLRKAYWRKSG
jgi:hypothetical protein